MDLENIDLKALKDEILARLRDGRIFLAHKRHYCCVLLFTGVNQL